MDKQAAVRQNHARIMAPAGSQVLQRAAIDETLIDQAPAAVYETLRSPGHLSPVCAWPRGFGPVRVGDGNV